MGTTLSGVKVASGSDLDPESVAFNVEPKDESESEPADPTRFSYDCPRFLPKEPLRLSDGFLSLSNELRRLFPSTELKLEFELRLSDTFSSEPRLKSEPAEFILPVTGPMFKSITSRDPVFNCKNKYTAVTRCYDF